MDMNMCADGVITDAEIAHYVARAKGGAALLITGSGAVAYPRGATSRKQPGLSEDHFIPGLRQLVDAVHEAGSLLCVQLCHHGKNARLDMIDDRSVLVPSIPEGRPDLSALADCTRSELTQLAATTAGRAPRFHEATEDDLVLAIDDFAEAARRAREAGADAVEIHAAHGYLLSTFLSPTDNRRTDRWGGSLENRAGLIVEVTAAVRAAVGSDVAVLVRISGQEFGSEDALTTADATASAVLSAAAGADAIHVTGYGTNSFANFTDGPLPEKIGAYRLQASAIKSALDIPVIAVGRITPELADEMLAAGDCDFVSMGRQLLADPDLVQKLRSGRQEQVRPCINCYVCVEQNFFDEPPICAVNPALAGHLPPFERAESSRSVLVVGGGPAGMEVARIARERGHRVTLLEAGTRLGGTAWFSQLTTPTNGPLITWLEHEIRRLGVDVVLSTRADVALVRSLAPDVVVVATGANRGRPDVSGAELPHVHTGDDLRALLLGEGFHGQPIRLRGLARLARAFRLTSDAGRIRELTRRWMPLGRNVVIVGGGLVGLELSEFLAVRGRNVTVLESSRHVGVPMAMPRRWTAVRRATEVGVTVVRGARLNEITTKDVGYELGGAEHRVVADEVIFASDVCPDSILGDRLAGLDIEVHTVGDAGEVGYITGAMHSAWVTASKL